MPASTITTQCCIAGGGPAGMMLGFLLARAGVNVMVLEKHADFFRDFRGDTIHPSTLELMHELGLLEEFLKLPASELDHAGRPDRRRAVRMGDLTHLPTRCKYIALMPQWDFLDFLAATAKRYPTFDLRMRGGGDGADRGRRAGRRCSRQDAGRRTRDPRRPRRSAATGVIRPCATRPAQQRRLWRADGRAVVSAAAQGDRRQETSAISKPADDDHARPRRLLAMRLCHPERRHRPHRAEGLDAFRERCRDVAVPCRPRRRIEKLG